MQIDSDVNASILEENLDALLSEETIYCPEKFKAVMAGKCNWRKTRVEFYQGEFWLVDDERELPAYAFEEMDEKATLVVTGELRLDPKINPDTLSDRLHAVYNYDSIWCTPAQKAALIPILVDMEGQILDSTPAEETTLPDEQSVKVNLGKEIYVNANYVAL